MNNGNSNDRLEQVNRLLEKVLGPGERLPEILTTSGFSLTQVEILFRDYLETYLDSIVAYIRETCSGSSDEPRRHDMMLRYYGLAESGKETLKSIGKNYNLSSERVRQLILLRFYTMREPSYQQSLRDHLKQTAHQILDEPIS
ncbi:MAG: hypothetical protein AAFR81_15180 [Chloroflexota bacterium]